MFFTGCNSTMVHGVSSSWFDNRTLLCSKDEVVGYGQSKSLANAKHDARVEIAETLQVDIDSLSKVSVHGLNHNYTKDVQLNSQSKSSVRLNALRVVKQERKNGLWRVALVYNNLRLIQKIVNKIKPRNLGFNHQYLMKTPLLDSLRRKFGFFPNTEVYAKNGQYYLGIENEQFLVTNRDFQELLVNTNNFNIRIDIKDELRHKERYFITTEFKDSGFASLFLVDSEGKVVNLFKNIELYDAKFTFPDSNEYEGLEARVADGKRESSDMFVALLCQKKEDMREIYKISERLEQDSFEFGKLLGVMEKCHFTTKVVEMVR
jgi:hypothetical protein